MPLALRHRDEPPLALPPLSGLDVRCTLDSELLARMQDKPASEIVRRFAAGHRAYVAFLNGEPAAFGWVATRTADIGEVGAAFALAEGERYLWNFVTLTSHRGLGIYPRLLDAIVRAESAEAERFWIVYAPENHASGAGIRKAGFADVAELSFDSQGRAGLRGLVDGGASLAARVLGVPEANDELAQCWRCARAGRKMSCAPGTCRCDYQVPKSGCAA